MSTQIVIIIIIHSCDSVSAQSTNFPTKPAHCRKTSYLEENYSGCTSQNYRSSNIPSRRSILTLRTRCATGNLSLRSRQSSSLSRGNRAHSPSRTRCRLERDRRGTQAATLPSCDSNSVSAITSSTSPTTCAISWASPAPST